MTFLLKDFKYQFYTISTNLVVVLVKVYGHTSPLYFLINSFVAATFHNSLHFAALEYIY